MKQSELDFIISKHEKWLRCEPGGERADLRGADLTGLKIVSRDLRFADLRNIITKGTAIVCSNLNGALYNSDDFEMYFPFDINFI